MKYTYNGGGVIGMECSNGEKEVVATCAVDKAVSAVNLLNRAAREQDRSHYTASARLYHRAEQVEGFKWESPR